MIRELETKDAGRFAWAAACDAQRRNTNNKSHYTAEQIRSAVTVRDLLDSAFSHSSLYINYRLKWISVKAEGARAKDALAKQVLALFGERGYSVVITPQGMTVRIDKVAKA
jgi:hypothetical protein